MGAIKQLVILSGKGGTGKTSLSAAFAHLAGSQGSCVSAAFVDADVDAANLSLVLQPDPAESHQFWGGSQAHIQAERCSSCGACVSVCRFDAIIPAQEPLAAYQINSLACEGCAACRYACPNEAIQMVPQQDGHWFRSQTPYGVLFHAELFAGKENSGKLVTLVKQQARLWAEDESLPLVIVDGPPGIGCPVISACSGAELGLIVTEPGLAGLHDLQRALGTLQHFRIPTVVCINKADLYSQGAQQIREFAAQENVEVLGEIPFDESIPQAMLQGAPVTQAFPHSPAANAIRKVWEQALVGLFPEKVQAP